MHADVAVRLRQLRRRPPALPRERGRRWRAVRLRSDERPVSGGGNEPTDDVKHVTPINPKDRQRLAACADVTRVSCCVEKLIVARIFCR